MRTVPSDITPEAGVDHLPAADFTLRQVIRTGLLGGLTAVFVSATGMVVAFKGRIIAGSLTLDYVLLVGIAVTFGYLATKPPMQLEGFEAARPGIRNVLGGALAGVFTGAVMVAFVSLVGNFNVRDTFSNVSPEMLERITFQQDLVTGSALLVLAAVGLSALGGALNLLAPRWRRAVLSAVLWVFLFGLLQVLIAQVLNQLGFTFIDQLYNLVGGLTILGAIVVFVVFFILTAIARPGRDRIRARYKELPPQQRRFTQMGALIVGVAVLAILPQILGSFLSEVLDLAGIFLLMALGLNIVVGFAGLLDLGYVAFFAVGAYATAVLTWNRPAGGALPGSIRIGPELSFWTALPFVVLAAAAAGIIVGVPVLRMRGDYLAIVTLGFGEIARILFLSTWLKPYFGGALGVQRIPNINLGPVEIIGSKAFFYFIFGFAVLVVYISYSLQNSRMGRAWTAIREDESVAEAMGVNIVAAKLWAFILGAILASFGGAMFAMKIHSVFPSSFSIVVSITILVIVIVGGIASVPGVVLAALLLVGVPELLQEFQQFRFLIYGVLLIAMMLKRPEGLIPSRRRARELREDEVLQDAWLKAQQEEAPREVVPGS
jgi:branched-chain amino acid transport system permease protein